MGEALDIDTAHTFRLRLGGLGFRVGTGVGEALDIDTAAL